jgi:hypothetical protein
LWWRRFFMIVFSFPFANFLRSHCRSLKPILDSACWRKPVFQVVAVVLPIGGCCESPSLSPLTETLHRSKKQTHFRYNCLFLRFSSSHWQGTENECFMSRLRDLMSSAVAHRTRRFSQSLDTILNQVHRPPIFWTISPRPIIIVSSHLFSALFSQEMSPK